MTSIVKKSEAQLAFEEGFYFATLRDFEYIIKEKGMAKVMHDLNSGTYEKLVRFILSREP